MIKNIFNPLAKIILIKLKINLKVKEWLRIYAAAQINNALWLLSQNQSGTKPFHRCRTIFY
jgi:hypothetical protein